MHNWLNWLLFGRSKRSIDPCRDKVDAQRLDTASRLMRAMAETVGRLLQVARDQAMSIPSLQPAFFRQEIDALAKGYRGPISPAQEQELGKSAAQLISSQRERELEFIRDREQELQALIAMIGAELQETVRDAEDFSSDMTRTLGAVDQAIEVDDLRRLREEVRTQVAQIRQQLELRRERERERVRSLEEQIETLSSKAGLTPETAQTDPLTTLYTREAFDKQIRAEASLAKRLRRPLSLVLVDVDRFALVNETYGQDIGDEVLAKLAERLIREFFRKTDFIARFGGEEFAVLLTQEREGVAQRAAESLRTALIQRPIPTAAGEVTITLSVAVTQYQAPESWEQFLARAVVGIEQAKQDGGNRVLRACEGADERAA